MFSSQNTLKWSFRVLMMLLNCLHVKAKHTSSPKEVRHTFHPLNVPVSSQVHCHHLHLLVSHWTTTRTIPLYRPISPTDTSSSEKKQKENLSFYLHINRSELIWMPLQWWNVGLNISRINIQKNQKRQVSVINKVNWKL